MDHLRNLHNPRYHLLRFYAEIFHSHSDFFKHRLLDSTDLRKRILKYISDLNTQFFLFPLQQVLSIDQHGSFQYPAVKVRTQSTHQIAESSFSSRIRSDHAITFSGFQLTVQMSDRCFPGQRISIRYILKLNTYTHNPCPPISIFCPQCFRQRI